MYGYPGYGYPAAGYNYGNNSGWIWAIIIIVFIVFFFCGWGTNHNI